MHLIDSKKDELRCGLIGSWMVSTGELDQALHLWQFTGGFQSIDQARTHLSADEVIFFNLISLSAQFSMTSNKNEKS